MLESSDESFHKWTKVKVTFIKGHLTFVKMAISAEDILFFFKSKRKRLEEDEEEFFKKFVKRSRSDPDTNNYSSFVHLLTFSNLFFPYILTFGLLRKMHSECMHAHTVITRFSAALE